MKSIYILCAEVVLNDQMTNNISIINVFEEIRPPALPIIIPRMTVLSAVTRENGDPNTIPFRLRISLADEILFEQENTYDFQEKSHLRSIMMFGGMPVTQPGILNFVILVNNNVFQTYQITVHTPPAPTVQQPAGAV